MVNHGVGGQTYVDKRSRIEVLTRGKNMAGNGKRFCAPRGERFVRQRVCVVLLKSKPQELLNALLSQ